MKLNLDFINRKLIVIMIVFLSLLFSFAGYLYYVSERNNVRQSKYDELKAIADLKEKQIDDWLKDKNAEAATTTQSPFFIEGVEKWMTDTSNLAAKQDLIKRLSLAVTILGNENVFLTSLTGEIYLSASPVVEKIDTLTKLKIKESVSRNEILLTDFYLCKYENKVHFDIVAPVITKDKTPIAVIVYRRDPEKFLYPLIQDWPTPSKSSETVILRVENDSVVFLNELRFRKNSALRMKIPLTQTEVPAVQAALGHTGMFEGVDYRKVRVLSDIRIIPETGWILLAKVDKKEIYTELYIKAIIIILFCFLIISLLGLGFFWVYNMHQRDIYMELYEKEKVLMQEQQKFKITMLSIGDGIITSDIDGRISYMNKYAEELTGWNLQDSGERHLFEVFQAAVSTDGDRENIIPDDIILKGIVMESPDDTSLLSKSGKKIPVIYTIAPIYSTPDNITGIVITFRDVTKQKLAEQALKKSEALFSKTFHSSPSGIAISRISDGTFINVNSAACELYGYTSEKLIGHSSLELGLLSKESREILVGELKLNGKLRSRELTLNTGTGESRDVLFSWEPIDFAGESCALATIIDITDRKKLEIERISKEAAEQANRTKSEFLANMSHEIRTPMNAVLGYTELLSFTGVDKTQKDYINSIQASGKSLLILINDILDLSKIEAGKLELEYEFVNTFSFFSEFERIFSLKVTEKGLKFTLDIASGTPKGLCIDEARVRQIVFNLIGNAIKFTSHGEIRLSLYTENPQLINYSNEKTEELIDLVIEVSDTGIGISKELQEIIFEPFTQERGYKQFGGTGLGLAITKRLASLMNGSVSVRSELGKGSTFIFKIPEIAYQRDFESSRVGIQINPEDIEFEKSVILIADDVEHNRSYLRDALKKTSLEIYEAEDGIAAFSLARKIVPDLIIADIRMPKMDGFELLSHIKEDPDLKHIPVLAYSASVLKAQKERIHKSDFAGLLIKPVNLTELYLALINILPYKGIKTSESGEGAQSDKDKVSEISDLPALIYSLESEHYKKWKTFLVTQPINEINEFGCAMVKLGTKHNSQTILSYGNDLINAAESFNIDSILKLLAKYKGIIENFKKQS